MKHRIIALAAFCFTLTALPANAGRCDAVLAEDRLLSCLGEQLTAVDAELNTGYKRLQSGLDKDSRQKLMRAQKQWLALRDADCEFEADSHRGGSGEHAVYLQCQIDQTSARIQAFKKSAFWR